MQIFDLFLLFAVSASCVACVSEWSQCAGKEFGSQPCDDGLSCVYFHEWYSQCQKLSSPNTPPPPPPPPSSSSSQNGGRAPPSSNDMEKYSNIAPPDNMDTSEVRDGNSFSGDIDARKKAFNAGAGSDINMQALIQASAAVETSFGTSGLNDAMDQSKKRTDSENFSAMRMNRAALRSWGYSEEQMSQMSQDTPDGNTLAAQAFKKGIDTLGFQGFMHLHRGGQTRYDAYKAGTLSDSDMKDTLSLMIAYHEVQAYMIQHNFVSGGTSVAYLPQGPKEI